MNIEDVCIGEGVHVNFDVLTQTLQLLEKNIQQFMAQANQIELDKNLVRKNSGGCDKLD